MKSSQLNLFYFVNSLMSQQFNNNCSVIRLCFLLNAQVSSKHVIKTAAASLNDGQETAQKRQLILY